MQWVIRTSDNVFLRDKGGEALATGEAEHAVSRVPDPRTETSATSDSSPTPIVMASHNSTMRRRMGELASSDHMAAQYSRCRT